MKGAYFLGALAPQKFEIRDLAYEGLGSHDVLVKNKACGVCGTDVHIYLGEKGSADVTPPVVLGHEYSGIVEEIGKDVSNVKVGDHVCIDPNIYCNECMPCRMGKKQNCENLKALGVTRDGGFAEYSIVPDTQCFVIKDDIPFEWAAMAEPLACVLHGIDLAHIHPGQSVLVIGGGAIGLLMAQVAKLSGASSVVVSEPVAKRREIALEVGADGVVDPLNEDIEEALEKYSGRKKADVVIECIGKPATIRQAFDLAGFSAQVILFGVPSPEATVELPLFDVYKKELHISGSMINPATHQRAVNLINSGKIKIEPLITHRFTLNHLEEAIQSQMGTDSLKVIVQAELD